MYDREENLPAAKIAGGGRRGSERRPEAKEASEVAMETGAKNRSGTAVEEEGTRSRVITSV